MLHAYAELSNTAVHWVVPSCPYCGRKHYHSAGGPKADRDSSLGLRVAHCDGLKPKPQYFLTTDREKHGRDADRSADYEHDGGEGQFHLDFCGDACPYCPVVAFVWLPYAMEVRIADCTMEYRCDAGHKWHTAWDKATAHEHARSILSEGIEYRKSLPYILKKKEAVMMRGDVRLHREGEQFAVSTNTDNERDFIDGVASALAGMDCGAGELSKWLPLIVDVACKMRGYKADVIEKRVIIAGAWLPTDHAAIVGAAKVDKEVVTA